MYTFVSPLFYRRFMRNTYSNRNVVPVFTLYPWNSYEPKLMEDTVIAIGEQTASGTTAFISKHAMLLADRRSVSLKRYDAVGCPGFRWILCCNCVKALQQWMITCLSNPDPRSSSTMTTGSPVMLHTCKVTLDISGSPIDFQWGSRKYPG